MGRVRAGREAPTRAQALCIAAARGSRVSGSQDVKSARVLLPNRQCGATLASTRNTKTDGLEPRESYNDCKEGRRHPSRRRNHRCRGARGLGPVAAGRGPAAQVAPLDAALAQNLLYISNEIISAVTPDGSTDSSQTNRKKTPDKHVCFTARTNHICVANGALRRPPTA